MPLARYTLHCLAIDGLKFKMCNPRDADQNLSKVSVYKIIQSDIYPLAGNCESQNFLNTIHTKINRPFKKKHILERFSLTKFSLFCCLAVLFFLCALSMSLILV